MLMTSFGLFTRVSCDGERSWYVELNNIDGRPMHECTTRGFFEKKQSRCVYADGTWWGRVSVVPATDIEEELTVYNIEVEGDNSYVCENLVVHNCNFNASGDTVIQGERLTELEQDTYLPARMELESRALHIWMPYVPGRQYMVTADVARGDGRDNSAAHVFDLSSMSQVAEYYAKVPPDMFAGHLVKIGEDYGKAILIIENNSVGLACLEHVRLANYPNVYYSRRGDQKPGQAVNTLFGPPDDDLIPGFTTTQRTRPLIVAKLEEYVRTKAMIIRSRRLLAELRTFIWNNGRAEAMKGYNDDLTMAAAIAAWARDTIMGPSFVTQEVHRKMLAGVSKTESLNTDITGASKDPRFVPHKAMGIFNSEKDPMKIRLPNGMVEDYGWLISRG
jgi:hypothetical protein